MSGFTSFGSGPWPENNGEGNNSPSSPEHKSLQSPTQPRKRNKIGRMLVYVLAAMGLLSLVFVGFAANFINALVTYAVDEPDESKVVLALDLDSPMAESEPDTLLGAVAFRDGQSFYSVIRGIRKAAKDDNVKMLAARIGSSPLGFAQTQELRDAIVEFKKSGKKTILFSQSFGTLGTGSLEYYAASVFDEIWLQPTGEVGMTGLYMEVPFLAQTFKQYGIKPEFSARHEYKSGAATMTDEGFTKAHKENMDKLADSLFNTLVKDVAKDRDIPEGKLLTLIDNAPVFADEALERNLVTKLGYLTEMEESIKKECKECSYIHAAHYSDTIAEPEADDDTPRIALIRAVGTIVSGESYFSPHSGASVMGADTMTEVIDEAREDKSIKAIVIRIDSPGGGYTPSDAIYYSLKKAAEKKPVVASLGNTAASGGYFIALAANKIVTQPSTLTGSVGVYGGKMVFKDLWKNKALNVNWGSISRGRNAGLTSSNTFFSESQKERFEASLDRVYKDFTAKLGKSRGLTPEEIDKAARGRVFTGADALKHKMVDDIGGIYTAIEHAKKLAKIEDKQPVRIALYPHHLTRAQLIMEFLRSGKLARIKTIQDMMLNSFVPEAAKTGLQTLNNMPTGEQRLKMSPVTVK